MSREVSTSRRGSSPRARSRRRARFARSAEPEKRESLDPVRDWIEKLERFWDHQLDRIQLRAERRTRRDR